MYLTTADEKGQLQLSCSFDLCYANSYEAVLGLLAWKYPIISTQLETNKIFANECPVIEQGTSYQF